VAGPDAIREMVKALKTVPTKRRHRPQGPLDHYTVAGKTGTAQKVENGKYVENSSPPSSVFPGGQPGTVHLGGHGRSKRMAIMAEKSPRLFFTPSPNGPPTI
jgi:hypothetical protein